MTRLTIRVCLAALSGMLLADSIARSQTTPPETDRRDSAQARTASNEQNESVGHRMPTAFKSVDTQILMGSPDPLPLEAVKAFPQLRFQRPVELTYADDDSNRLFVVEQRGIIHVFEQQETVAQTKVFLDIQSVVSRDGNEEGLLGLAFHPQYKDNGEFFVYYSTRPRASVLSRFRVSDDDPNRADRDSEEVLMRIDQPYANHNGGSIRFGPDGFLYIGLGDGGLADDPHAHAQNLQTLLGSILRIDIDRKQDDLPYAIPADNPFAKRADARGEIWAYGLRNVWRMAFDSQNGQLWAADVGQDRVEEINLIRRGGNYGWNMREGFQSFEPNVQHKPTSLIDPLVEYSREDGQSVTGGQVYRGAAMPEYQGAYFYGDYLSGKVWILRLDENVVTEDLQVAATNLEIAAFGEDANGEMYLCAFDGSLYQLRPREIDLKAVAESFPRKLSETGLFASVADNEPVEGMIPYEMNLPFWSDYAAKDRYIALPEQGKIKFDETEKWQFPVGTVFVKTFWMHLDRVNMTDPVRLETRLLVSTPYGWEGYTYVYNDEQTDALLLDGSLLKPIEVRTSDGMVTQPYYFPSRSDCFACHTRAEGFVLGMTTRQMNHELAYRGKSENQLSLLNRLNAFTEPLQQTPDELERFPLWGFGNLDRSQAGDDEESSQENPENGNPLSAPSGDRQVLAKAWLEVNCAVCHRPQGIAPHNRDMRFHTKNDDMRLIGEDPSQGQLGPPGTKLVQPSRPLESELFLRINRRGPRQMPPLGTKVVDPIGHEVIKQWILEMQKE